ncbi:MAG: GIY-YIG nuclease family protein [Clostridia bacterium]
MKFYIYLLRCADDTLYCGFTNNVEARVRAHNESKGAKYTKARLPVKLVYTEEYETKSQALKREIAIKKMTRQEKLTLIEK